MPAGDAGLDLAYLRQTVGIVGYLLPSHCEQLFTEIDRLRAQLAAQQAVVDAARWIEEDGWTPATCGALMNALKQLPANTAQSAQPEGERAR